MALPKVVVASSEDDNTQLTPYVTVCR
eukprot:SAG31_NODE_33073_length_348_cov_0.775100_1_plen_26_part_10